MRRPPSRMPKGEYVPARAGRRVGNGIIRQRALPTADGGMTPLLFAVRDGNVAMTRLLLERGADISQSSGNHTSPLLIALLNGQVGTRDRVARRGAPTRTPPTTTIAARCSPRSSCAISITRNTPICPTDGRDPLDLIKALLEKGRRSQQQNRYRSGARADAVRWLLGELRWADAVHARRAVGRHRGDATAARARRRSEYRHDAGHDGADGRRRHQLDPRPDVQPSRGRIRRGREAVPGARRRRERRPTRWA